MREFQLYFVGDIAVCDIGFRDEILLQQSGYIVFVLFEDRGNIAGDMCGELFSRLFYRRKRFPARIQSGTGTEEYDLHDRPCRDVFFSSCRNGPDLLCPVAQFVECLPAFPARPEKVRAAISLCSGGNLASPERALLRSPLGSRTVVHSPRFSLAKPARLCDITAYGLIWSVCRLTATGVVVWSAACAAYKRLAALVRRERKLALKLLNALPFLQRASPARTACGCKRQLPQLRSVPCILSPGYLDSSISLWREWVF